MECWKCFEDILLIFAKWFVIPRCAFHRKKSSMHRSYLLSRSDRRRLLRWAPLCWKRFAPWWLVFPCHFRDDEVLAGIAAKQKGGGNFATAFFMWWLGLPNRMTQRRSFSTYFWFGPARTLSQTKWLRLRITSFILQTRNQRNRSVPDPMLFGDLEIISRRYSSLFHFETSGLALREKSNSKVPRSDWRRDKLRSALRVPWWMKRTHTSPWGSYDRMAFGPDLNLIGFVKCLDRAQFLIYNDFQNFERWMATKGDFSPKDVRSLPEYDCARRCLYYLQNYNVTMPYSMLMEIALQPCGLLGAYMGSTLQFPENGSISPELDGDGENIRARRETDLEERPITTSPYWFPPCSLRWGRFAALSPLKLSVWWTPFFIKNSSFDFFTAKGIGSSGWLG